MKKKFESLEINELQLIKNLVYKIQPWRKDITLTEQFANFEVGVEVTLAGFSGLNLDHHGTGFTSDSPSAIEQALTIELEKVKNKKMGTVLPDMDSAGAMAVILLRSENENIDEKLVQAIGLIDRKGPSVFDEEGSTLLGFSDEEFAKYQKKIQEERGEVKDNSKEIKELEKYIKGLEKRLKNKSFVEKAPEEVVALEKDRLVEAKKELNKLI